MKVINIIRNIFFVAALIIIIAAAACIVFGYKPAVVMSGSMEPTFHTGSVIFVDKGSSYKVGDAVAFNVNKNYVTHRIVKEENDLYVTKGDNNKTEDPWRISKEAIDGKVVFSIPYIGYAFKSIATRKGIITACVILMCLVIAQSLSDNNKQGENQ